jgi:hypothetical protein
MTNKEIKVSTLGDLRTNIMISLLNKLADEGFLPSIGEETFDRIFPKLKSLYDEAMSGCYRDSMYDLLREHGYDGSKNEAVEALFYSLRNLSIIDNVDNSAEAINAIKDYEMLRLMEYDGGGEGGSEDCYSIIKVGQRYFRCNYEYYSYEGFDYGNGSEVYEVAPKTIEVVQYFAL